MAVLKADKSVGFTKDAVVLDLGDLGRQAARLQMAAQEKADKLVTDAELKAKKLIAEASKKGFDQGHAEGLAQGVQEGREQGKLEALKQASEELAQVQAAWSDVAGQWDTQTKQMAVEARQVVAEFALKMAERLVHRVIEVDPSVIVDQVAGALALVLRPMDVSVSINPSELPALREAMPQLMAEFDHLEHIHLVEDESVSPGGCLVSYGHGQIDATIETQIRRVVDLILPAEPGVEDPGLNAVDPTHPDIYRTDNLDPGAGEHDPGNETSQDM